METPASQPAVAPTRVRFGIMVMLFVVVVINYLDRSNLSIAGPMLAQDLHLDPARMGWLFSAFGWTYAFCQIPGGWAVDRVKPRFLYAALLIGWSLATFSLGFAGSIAVLIALRFAIGALEAPSFPINNRVVTTWFPERERATAISFYTSGQFVGIAFLTPVLSYLQATFSWEVVFMVTGGVGVVWGVAWFYLYRQPGEHRRVNQAEIEQIRAGGGLVDLDARGGKARVPLQWADLRLVLGSRKLWAVYIGQFCLTSAQWFFLTWFMTYLVQYRGLGYVRAGFFAMVPFFAAFCGVLTGGVLSDWLVRSGMSVGVARRIPIVGGLLLSMLIMGANYVQSPVLVIAFLAIAFFGNGFASITWVLVSSIAPARLIGLSGGCFNFFGNLSAFTVPMVIGYLVNGSDFSPALSFIAALALIGALSYIFLLGKVERLPDRPIEEVAVVDGTKLPA
ncbi:MAG: MFS transporter [Acetobacteraceae bacterium]|nr:MFS transporter [Acetobacteraceae bacterium]